MRPLVYSPLPSVPNIETVPRSVTAREKSERPHTPARTQSFSSSSVGTGCENHSTPCGAARSVGGFIRYHSASLSDPPSASGRRVYSHHFRQPTSLTSPAPRRSHPRPFLPSWCLVLSTFCLLRAVNPLVMHAGLQREVWLI